MHCEDLEVPRDLFELCCDRCGCGWRFEALVEWSIHHGLWIVNVAEHWPSRWIEEDGALHDKHLLSNNIIRIGSGWLLNEFLRKSKTVGFGHHIQNVIANMTQSFKTIIKTTKTYSKTSPRESET